MRPDPVKPIAADFCGAARGSVQARTVPGADVPLPATPLFGSAGRALLFDLSRLRRGRLGLGGDRRQYPIAIGGDLA